MEIRQLPAHVEIRFRSASGPRQNRQSDRSRLGLGIVLGICGTLLYLHIAAEPRIQVSAAEVRFLPTLVNARSATREIVLNNSGSGILHVGDIFLDGMNSADFNAVSSCPKTGLAQNQGCIISILLAPQSSGTLSADLVIPNDSDESSKVVSVSGIGILPPSPAVTAHPSSLRFESPAGIPASLPLTLQNSGNGTAAILDVLLKDASHAFTDDRSCDNVQLAHNHGCSLMVTFSATQLGEAVAEIEINYMGGKKLTVPLRGVAVSNTPTQPPEVGKAEIDPKNVFIHATQGSGRQDARVSIRNAGPGTLRLNASRLAESSEFTLGNQCPPELSAGATCVLILAFQNQQTGYNHSTLLISASDGDYSVPLDARVDPAAKPAVEIAPTRLTLASQANYHGGFFAKFLRDPGLITIYNTGTAALQFDPGEGSFVIDPPGEFDLDLAAVKTACNPGGQLPPNGNCQLHVVYRGGGGTAQAQLEIFDNADASPQRVPLLGIGAALRGTLKPSEAEVSFAAVPVSTGTRANPASSAAATGGAQQPIVLTNVGNAPLSFKGIRQTPDVAFHAEQGCPNPLPPQQSCVLTITFSPTTIEYHSGTVTILHDGSNSPTAISVHGDGMNPWVSSPMLRHPLPRTTVPAAPIGRQ